MQLEFHGAAGTVTGSRYRLTTERAKLMIDAGLFQGRKKLRLMNWNELPFDPGGLDALLLTHVHIDHSGYVPRLVRNGFKGPIFATPATVDLAKIVLMDAAKIQEEDAHYANKRGYSRHKPALPLYEAEDAERAVSLMRPVRFGEWHSVADGVKARWTNTGHLLGAAMIDVEAEESGAKRTILFSGDIGRYDRALHLDPAPRPPTDYLVIESTYGNRLHPKKTIEEQLAEPLRRCFERGGVALFPAFAVGRSQLVTLILRRLMLKGAIPEVPVHIDSPMAVNATRVYSKYLDERNIDPDVYEDGRTEIFPDNVGLHRTVADSKRLNDMKGPRAIISSSGMIVGGRILHHLKKRLPDPKNLVCLVGYQAEGTRGRSLVDGARTLKMHGQRVEALAEVLNISGFSGHADAGELMAWYGTEEAHPRGVWVTHGEPEAAAALADRLRDSGAGSVRTPEIGDVFDLA